MEKHLDAPQWSGWQLIKWHPQI